MQAGQQLTKPKFLCCRRASVRQRLVAGLVFLAIVAFFGLLSLTAAGKFDMGRWTGPCGFKQKHDLPCPACGMTTAAVAFVRGRIFEAFYLQPASALLCCVLLVAAFLGFLTAVFGVYSRVLERFLSDIKIRHVILALAAIIAAGWAVTLARALAEKS